MRVEPSTLVISSFGDRLPASPDEALDFEDFEDFDDLDVLEADLLVLAVDAFEASASDELASSPRSASLVADESELRRRRRRRREEELVVAGSSPSAASVVGPDSEPASRLVGAPVAEPEPLPGSVGVVVPESPVSADSEAADEEPRDRLRRRRDEELPDVAGPASSDAVSTDVASSGEPEPIDAVEARADESAADESVGAGGSVASGAWNNGRAAEAPRRRRERATGASAAGSDVLSSAAAWVATGAEVVAADGVVEATAASAPSTGGTNGLVSGVRERRDRDRVAG
jgi:hypothetical protein